MRLGMVIAVAVLAGMTASSAQAANLIKNGNFSRGNKHFASQYSDVTEICSDTEYAVASNPADVNCYGDWASFGDHTNGSGLMLIVNGAITAGTAIWAETVTVQPNTNYVLVFWGASCNTNNGGNDAGIQAYFNGQAVGSQLNLPANYDGWHRNTVKWNSGSNSQVTIALIDQDTQGTWNDFALDDISMKAK